MTDPKPMRWQPEATVSTGAGRLWTSLGVWGSVAVALGLFFILPSGGKNASSQPTYETPPFETAKTLFVIAKSPSEDLLKLLKLSHHRGVSIRFITDTDIAVPYRTMKVSSEKIPRNGVLIDGTAWYPLPDFKQKKMSSTSALTTPPQREPSRSRSSNFSSPANIPNKSSVLDK